VNRRPDVTERISRGVARLAALEIPGSAAAYARLFGARVDEAERPLAEYGSVLDFFTRRLAPGSRPVDPDPDALISPVDGRLLAVGPVGDGKLVQGKDRRYPLATLLDDHARAATLLGGSYATIYLSPRDYHRIHAPVAGALTRAKVVPGALWPVNDLGTRWVPEVFVRNRRLVVELSSERFGAVFVIMIGAINVGGIRASFDPSLTTSYDRPRSAEYAPPSPIARGDELGVFELDSNVVVVTEAALPIIDQRPGQPVRWGRSLGRRAPSSRSE